MAATIPSTSISGAPAPAARRGHLLFVDAVRGAACLWVIMHHTQHTFSSLPVSHDLAGLPFFLLVHFSEIGWLGVSLFLELSGFCLFYPILKRQAAHNLDFSPYKLDVIGFFRKRARRILPPYYAALILSCLLAMVEQRLGLNYQRNFLSVFYGKSDLVLHLTMLYNLKAASFASINPAFWSLALESDLYLLFPVLVFLAARFGLRGILIPTFAIAVLWQGWAYHRLGFSWNYVSSTVFIYDALPGRAFEFACGMTAAYFVAKPQPGQYKIAAVLLAIMLVPGLWYVMEISRFGPLLDQIWGVAFGCLLVLLSRIDDSFLVRNRIGSALVWIGTISYSLYLIHYPLIMITSLTVLHLPNTELLAVSLGVVRTICLIGLAYLFHLAFERPFMTKPGVKIKTDAQAEAAAAVNPAP